MQHQQSFGRLIGMLSNEIKRGFNTDLGSDLITAKQQRILHYIMAQAAERAVFQRDIEQEFNLRRSSASTMLANMEKAGVITRESVSYDARLKRILITKKGEAIRAEVLKDCQNMEQKLTMDIPEEDLKKCALVLEQMITNLRKAD